MAVLNISDLVDSIPTDTDSIVIDDGVATKRTTALNLVSHIGARKGSIQTYGAGQALPASINVSYLANGDLSVDTLHIKDTPVPATTCVIQLPSMSSSPIKEPKVFTINLALTTTLNTAVNQQVINVNAGFGDLFVGIWSAWNVWAPANTFSYNRYQFLLDPRSNIILPF